MVMSGPIPAGSPSVSAKARGRMSRIGRIGGYLTSIIAPRRSSWRKRFDCASNFSANSSSRTWRLRGAFRSVVSLRAAQREDLDALRRDLRRRQAADRRIVENLAQRRRQIGRGALDLVAHHDVAQRARERQALVAILEPRAQGLGLALARLDVPRPALRGTTNRIGRSMYSKPAVSLLVVLACDLPGRRGRPCRGSGSSTGTCRGRSAARRCRRGCGP